MLLRLKALPLRLRELLLLLLLRRLKALLLLLLPGMMGGWPGL